MVIDMYEFYNVIVYKICIFQVYIKFPVCQGVNILSYNIIAHCNTNDDLW